MNVSIIVPAYGRPHELSRCLNSIIRSSYGNWECIVVDDAGPDGLRAVCDALSDSRIRYVRNLENQGPAGARMVAFKIASGDCAVCVDSDWELFPWALSRGVDLLRENAGIAAVTGMHLRVDAGALNARVAGGRYIMTPKKYLGHPAAPDCVSFIRKAIYKAWAGGAARYYAFEIALWFNFSCSENQLYIEEPWTRYHTDLDDRVSLRGMKHGILDAAAFVESKGSYLLENRYEPIIQIIEAAYWQSHRYNDPSIRKARGVMRDFLVGMGRAGLTGFARFLLRRGLQRTNLTQPCFSAMIGEP